jgi:hypothetical protein
LLRLRRHPGSTRRFLLHLDGALVDLVERQIGALQQSCQRRDERVLARESRRAAPGRDLRKVDDLKAGLARQFLQRLIKGHARVN